MHDHTVSVTSTSSTLRDRVLLGLAFGWLCGPAAIVLVWIAAPGWLASPPRAAIGTNLAGLGEWYLLIFASLTFLGLANLVAIVSLFVFRKRALSVMLRLISVVALVIGSACLAKLEVGTSSRPDAKPDGDGSLSILGGGVSALIVGLGVWVPHLRARAQKRDS